MQIFKTNLFKTNNIEINLNNRTNKSSKAFVSEPISNNEISKHYYPAFKSNVEIYEKMKKVSSKKANIEEFKKLFEGLTDKAKENFNGTLKKFDKFGINSETLLVAFVQHPPLFCQSPDTLEANVKSLVEKFKENGLSIDDYIKACIKQPQLFCLLPDNIETNVKGLVDKFKDNGLSVDDYVKACVKKPPLLCLSPNTVAEHINAYMYIKKNSKGFIDKNTINSVLKKDLSYSTSLIYLKGIVEPQIKEQYPQIKNVEGSNIKNKLKTLFEKSPDMQFEIKILKDKMADNFIKVMQEFAEKDLKAPNAFKIKQAPFEEL